MIPDPIDDRKFQEWKESGKSGILLGIILNPKKCIGIKVNRTPMKIIIKERSDNKEVVENNIEYKPVYKEKYIMEEKIDIMAPKDNTKWKWPGI